MEGGGGGGCRHYYIVCVGLEARRIIMGREGGGVWGVWGRVGTCGDVWGVWESTPSTRALCTALCPPHSVYSAQRKYSVQYAR